VKLTELEMHDNRKMKHKLLLFHHVSFSNNFNKNSTVRFLNFLGF
jgi:hypothetical protein